MKVVKGDWHSENCCHDTNGYHWLDCLHLFPSLLSSSHSLPLEGMKRKIMRNLRTLEEEGMVNSKNDYQEIINAIAKVKTDRVLCRRVLIGSQSLLKAHLHIIYVTQFC